MRKPFLLMLLAALILLNLACGTTEYDMEITLTNSQGKAVKYGGFYMIQSVGDSTPMQGYTPGEYTFILEEGDVVEGVFYKDTTDAIDVLTFKLYVDDKVEMTLNQIEPYPSEVSFRYPLPGPNLSITQ